ncbi:MAG: tetratricopeptide repeat protein, partial [Gemmatimonadota bacterium]|nr:tetratricopeptide repeat protein [Gemmatimonadota bacterium]
NILGDNELPYFEPQAGAYSDNQPDYHWIAPGETKVFSIYWYPVRDIGVWDYANLEGALNLELDKGTAKFGWSATGANKNARVVVTAGAKTIFDKRADVCPASPFRSRAKAPTGSDLYSLKMTVISSRGDTLLAFGHPRPTDPPLPAGAPHSDPPPETLETVDELFTVGNKVEKFSNTGRALNYYNAALEKDPGDVRTNTALGLILLKRGLYQKALWHFEKALERDRSFTKAIYNQALALLRTGEVERAGDRLNRASYDLAYYAAANFELAQIAAAGGRFEKALEYIERSVRGNGDNAQAYAVKALILNRLARPEEALEVANEVQSVDPLDLLSLAERAVALRSLNLDDEAAAAADTLMMLTRGDSENHLELAIRYARCGCYNEALEGLGLLIIGGMNGWVEQDKLSPMLYYYAAWYNNLQGNSEAVTELLERGTQASPKYCFPNRLESFEVLEWATEQNPDDARAIYYLGNLLYSRTRSDEAIECWKKSVVLEPGNAVAQRNLGLALSVKNDLEGAQAAYKAAIKADPMASVAVKELDNMHSKLNWPIEKRNAYLEKHLAAVGNNDALLTRYISILVKSGRYDKALEWLYKHHFHSWEGRYGIHQYWVESHIRKGDQLLEAGNKEEALKHYELSFTYPFNLEVAPLPGTVHARKLYKIGTALEALGRKAEAEGKFRTVVAERDTMSVQSAYRYYLGLALEKLGRTGEAKKVFEEMLTSASKTHLSAEDMHYDPGRNPEALSAFRRALALDGLGRRAESEAVMKEAVELDPIVNLRAFSPPRAGW